MTTLMESSTYSVDLEGELSADEIDARRQTKAAYEYLCRLHEVRRSVGTTDFRANNCSGLQ